MSGKIGNGPTGRPPYSITKAAPTDDDYHLASQWTRRWYGLSRSLGFVAAIAQFAYLFELGRCIQTWQTSHSRTPWFAWVFLSIKTVDFARTCVNQLWRLFSLGERNRPKLRLAGNHVPTVDLIIVTAGESNVVILDTVKAACNVDYPESKFRVILSDDAADASLKASSMALTREHPNLLYYSRATEKGVLRGFKAGNIHSTMAYAASLGPAEWCCVVDADMICSKDLLRALLAHCANDKDVAMAVPPLRFYNIPINDPLWQTQTAQTEDDEIIRDAVDATWCTGSGFIFRPTAVTGVGGFSYTSLGDDILCSQMLLGKGWKVVYVHEELQLGLMPETFSGNIKQRSRWAIGAMQNSLELRFCINSPSCEYMIPLQRLSGFVYCLNAWSSTLVELLILVSIPACLLLNHDPSASPLIPVSNTQQMRNLARMYFLSLLSSRLYEYAQSIRYGYRTLLRKMEARVWNSPYFSLAMLRELLLPYLGGMTMSFTASGSLKSELDERNPELRPRLFKRVAIMLLQHGLGFHVGMLSLVCLAIYRSAFRSMSGAQSEQEAWFNLKSNVLWPGIQWEIYTAFLTPIIYTIWPPTMPARREMMEKDLATGVWRPKEDNVRDRWNAWSWMLEVPRAVAFLWALYCAV